MRRVRKGLIVACLALVLLTSGCTSLVGEKWVAKVNSVSITVDDYNTRVEKAQQAYTTQGVDFTTEEGKANLVSLKSQILSTMVQAQIIMQEVKKLGLSTDDATIKTEMENQKAQFGDETEFNNTLAKYGITEEELLNSMTLSLNVTKDVTVSESDVAAYYETNKANYGEKEQVKAKHILVNTEDEAKAIIAQLKASTNASQLFEQLAKEKSTDPGSKDAGGELGYFTRDTMLEEFSTAAFAQSVGSFSQEPVKTDYGYHVILVEDHKQAVEADFDKIKEQVQTDALNQAQTDKLQTDLSDLEKNSKIEYASGYQPAS